MDLPLPDTNEAVLYGCSCRRLDTGDNTVYVLRADCPLGHGDTGPEGFASQLRSILRSGERRGVRHATGSINGG